jgi:hypothetical protein
MGKWSGPPVEVPGTDYVVYDSPQQVPADVWDDRGRVVERFVVEREGDLHCLRMCYFLGDAERNFVIRERSRLVKTTHDVKYEEAPVPPGMRRIRERLGLHYGKLDYVLQDGEPVLFDVNRTPACTGLNRLGLTPQVAATLAGGIELLLAR